jgi:hypothetical protein
MADAKNNIYIDSTLLSGDVGDTFINTSVEFVTPNILGNYNLPIVYQTGVSGTTVADCEVEYIVNSAVSGTNDVQLFFSTVVPNEFGVVPSLVDYSVISVVSGTLDTYIFYFTGYSPISGTVDEVVTFIAGEEYTSFENYIVEHNCGSVISGSNSYVVEHKYDPAISGSNSYWQNYMNFSGNVSIEGDPIPSVDHYNESIVDYEVNDYNCVELNTYVDITFAGWATFPFPTDIYSVDAGITETYLLDVITINGGLVPHYLDVYSTILTTSGIDFDVCCSLLDIEIINVDVEITTGRMGYINYDVYSTAVKNPIISCDVELYPLEIRNFSLGIGEYTTASGYISVDVLDHVYEITTSGTYFRVDDEIVPVTFSGIDNGYRMFYDPDDDFSSLNGPTVFTVRAENDNGNVLEIMIQELL